ncbi:hypothetical protein BD770DRAFT_445607 [Pilaira anomala]|nr:hypothetical protein BD770DRAFT_445607 [Pilaira anomala]
MKILYKVGEFPDPGDRDLYNGIEEINQGNYKDALKHFEKGANYDNEYASLFTAILYFTGFGFANRDPAKTISLLKKVALKWKTPIAQYLIGITYLYGDKGITQHEKQSIHWLTLAADNGWTDAMGYLGHAYSAGNLSIKQDMKKGIVWLEKIARINDKEIINSINNGILYLFGNKELEISTTQVEKDTMATLKLYLCLPVRYLELEKCPAGLNLKDVKPLMLWDALTNKNIINIGYCQMVLGTLIRGTSKNFAQAVYWNRKAAEKGILTAGINVGLAYENGEGVNQDYEEAMKWYKLMYDRYESPSAAHRMGNLYRHGLGVKRDCKMTLKYFNYAILKIEGMGRFLYLTIGDIYEHGRDGVPQCYKKAYHYYLKAFESGDIQGAATIGYLYYTGSGVPEDEEKAYQWASKGLAMNCPSAQFLLGFMWLNGYQGKTDLHKALFLFKKAVDGGHSQALSYIALTQEIIDNGAKVIVACYLNEKELLSINCIKT